MAYLRFNTTIEWRLSVSILNTAVWLVFGLLFFLFPIKQNEISQNVGQKESSYKLLIISIIVIISLSYFSNLIGDILYLETDDYKPEIIRNTIGMSSMFIFGIVFMFLPNVVSGLKMKISTLIVLITGLIGLTLLSIDLSSGQDLMLNVVTGFSFIFDILFYPALIFIFLNTFNTKYRAAYLSAFYAIGFLVGDIAGILKGINQDLTLSLFLILLVGFILIKYVFNVKEAPNS